MRSNNVLWGWTFETPHYDFVIQDLPQGHQSEAYIVPRAHPDMHNHMGHFSGSRDRCFAELRRLVETVYLCRPDERCPGHATCAGAREFLKVTELPGLPCTTERHVC